MARKIGPFKTAGGRQKPTVWKTGKKPGWKFRAKKAGRTIPQIRRTQRRITARAGVAYHPYSPGTMRRSYNRRLGRRR
jgi:hypothetical protein